MIPPKKTLTAKMVTDHIRAWLPWGGSFCHANVFLKNSPWESDLIRVMKSGYWHEYEIKLSVADYRKDFQKKVIGCDFESPRKHTIYSSHVPFEGAIPKPATFSFVTPKGLLDGVRVPSYCGLIEIEVDRWDRAAISVRQEAPRLKKPTRLEAFHLFNLCQKRSD